MSVMWVFATIYGSAFIICGALVYLIKRRQRRQREAQRERDSWNEDIDAFLDEIEP